VKRAILVTGAGSGIGKAAVELLASSGFEVFATYRSSADGAALAGLANVQPICMDVTSAEEIDRAYQAIEAQVGDAGLYAIVNNAGITYAAPFEFADEGHARQVMEVNLMAPFRISKKFLPLLQRHNANIDGDAKARIVNISSWAASLGQPFIGFYNASKFALAGLSESMFYDLGLLGIHVVLASPGTTKTPLLGKTTGGATEVLDSMPLEGRARYEPLLTHFASIGAQYSSSPLFQGPQQVARKLLRILEARKPRYAYDLSLDACVVNRFIARFAPWKMKVAMNRSIFQLSGSKLPAPTVAAG